MIVVALLTGIICSLLRLLNVAIGSLYRKLNIPLQIQFCFFCHTHKIKRHLLPIIIAILFPKSVVKGLCRVLNDHLVKNTNVIHIDGLRTRCKTGLVLLCVLWRQLRYHRRKLGKKILVCFYSVLIISLNVFDILLSRLKSIINLLLIRRKLLRVSALKHLQIQISLM